VHVDLDQDATTGRAELGIVEGGNDRTAIFQTARTTTLLTVTALAAETADNFESSFILMKNNSPSTADANLTTTDLTGTNFSTLHFNTTAAGSFIDLRCSADITVETNTNVNFLLDQTTSLFRVTDNSGITTPLVDIYHKRPANGDVMTVYGTAIIDSIVVPSDVNIKQNIVPKKDILLRLKQSNIHAYSYAMKQREMPQDGDSEVLLNRERLGLLAQEIQEIFPEATQTTKQHGEEILAVDIYAIVSLCLAALKELADRT
jgi:hypothetical protein